MKKPDPNSPWDEKRCRELSDLELLVREVGTINHGSSALERIQRCIDLAESLSRIDLDHYRTSFLEFLRKEAIRSRFPNAATEPKS